MIIHFLMKTNLECEHHRFPACRPDLPGGSPLPQEIPKQVTFTLHRLFILSCHHILSYHHIINLSYGITLVMIKLFSFLHSECYRLLVDNVHCHPVVDIDILFT